ncbi:MAG TPA: methanogen output domain 1-containing protein [Methanobacteriaceae archaeon]|nr:methanogen output domain 1-containing protein [Methanobacteriaceae archaeon]
MVGERILIVEDESISALEISETLESWGYRIISVVDTGEKAVQESLELKPDLILMDITLKGDMDGIDAAAIIKSFLDVPLIYLTALSDSDIFTRVSDTQANAYMIKPIQEAELRNNVELSLQNQKQKEKEILNNQKAGLKDVQLFMRSALPELASTLPIIERSLFLGRFIRLFEENMKPSFHEYSQKQSSIFFENASSDEKLKIYLSWVSNLYSHLGFKVQPRSRENSGVLTVKRCSWSYGKPNNVFLCLICQSIMQLTYSWTALPGKVQAETNTGVLQSVCRFDFDLDLEE